MERHEETSNRFTKFCERPYKHLSTFDKLQESSIYDISAVL